MPRAPTKKSPIRQLRKIIGNKTQIGFARSLGISGSALKRIENQDLRLTRKIALRIFAETGANLEKLLAGKLRTENGEKYTSEFYKKWKERWTNQNEAIAIDRAKALGWWTKILFRASVVGSRRRLWQVWRTVADAIEDCARDFDLRSQKENILAKEKPRVKWNLAGRTPDEIAEIEKERLFEESKESDYHRHREKVMAALTRQKSKQPSSRLRSRRA